MPLNRHMKEQNSPFMIQQLWLERRKSMKRDRNWTIWSGTVLTTDRRNTVMLQLNTNSDRKLLQDIRNLIAVPIHQELMIN